MPKQKDLKRIVRSRMKKTGESYTAARAQLTKKAKSPSIASASPSQGLAERAGMRDEAIQAKTGKTWQQWTRALDAVDAHTMPHRDIAQYVHDTYDISGWWSQAITVGYERIRGLRDIGQRRGGGYEASKSKTFPVPVARLYRAFATTAKRRRWLPDPLTIRKATEPKSMRIAWPDGSNVEVYFVTKGAGKSQVAVQHRRLSSRPDADTMKAYWGERLEVLGRLLAESK
jgi:hypothetical protein